ncbi:MAG TPA: IS1595 family transposase [Firmicutes bacterium]|nr:IS1595 family transposase [Bacillota bacterium]
MAVRLSQQLDTRLETAWLMLHKIRAAMGQRDAEYRLGGLVRLDDAFLANLERKGSTGRGTARVSVIVGVSETEDGEAGRVKMKAAKSLTSATIRDVAKQILKPGATVLTDGLLAYEVLRKEGFNHEFVVVSQGARSLRQFAWVHKFISNAKAFIPGTCHGLG